MMLAVYIQWYKAQQREVCEEAEEERTEMKPTQERVLLKLTVRGHGEDQRSDCCSEAKSREGCSEAERRNG
jgi:hypothetical protein